MTEDEITNCPEARGQNSSPDDASKASGPSSSSSLHPYPYYPYSYSYTPQALVGLLPRDCSRVMASSIYLPQRGHSPGLPVHTGMGRDKFHRHAYSSSWTEQISLPIPGVRTRRLRILVPKFDLLYRLAAARLGHRRGPLILILCALFLIITGFSFSRQLSTNETQWPRLTPGNPSTLVFQREDIKRIWQWEVESGHYPSRVPVPAQVELAESIQNPALPPLKRSAAGAGVAGFLSSSSSSSSWFKSARTTDTHATGRKRVYLDIQSRAKNVAYPPRPVPGSIADLDIVMEHCDFGRHKYVRDCLEVLRLGGGLDNGGRVRRGKMDEWKYIYVEGETDDIANSSLSHSTSQHISGNRASPVESSRDPNAGLTRKRNTEWEPHLSLPHTQSYLPHSTLSDPCDDVDHPRIFHMFWTGPFTDKPYLALLSFLYTQNLGLHEKVGSSQVCHPQIWLWINPGPAASVPNPTAMHDMFDSLKESPWAAPFLHPRFHDIIKFKLWNTTEQLDNVPELKEEWRLFRNSLFNSDGHVINLHAKDPEQLTTVTSKSNPDGGTDEEAVVARRVVPTKQSKSGADDMLSRAGSKSSSTYDRMSVILSDMARFIVCHRYGGIYLDADTIFLRDWEELWGWKGAFAYRWSRLEKYNTAVLKLNKGSALGSFLFRTALRNGLDFHPMKVSRYTKDAHLEELLLRLPDALFDSAWLNTEYFQRERPPQPYFKEFADFFDTPTQDSAAPQALGFDGFFKGAYSYHFHNSWWKPFDPARNWPDLGPRFAQGERKARVMASATPAAAITSGGSGSGRRGIVEVNMDEEEDLVSDDRRDLDWATVLKRTFESYIRGERPNMYGEWLEW